MDNTTSSAQNTSLQGPGGPQPSPALFVTTVVIGSLGILLNGALLMAIARNTREIFASNGAYMVANVAVADFLTGIMTLLYSFLAHTRHFALIALFWTSVEASLVTVFAMSLARYIAVLHPFRAHRWLSKSSTIICCLIIWIISAVCGVLHYFSPDVMVVILGSVLEITTLATLFLYYKLFTSLSHRSHVSLSVKAPADCTNESLLREIRRENNLTTVVVIITVIMIVTVLPYHIAGQIFLLYKFVIAPPHGSASIGVFLTYFMPIELLNFVINPIVYAWRLPKYRKALLNTFKLC